jgi:multidrug resistance protein, MATE family
LKFKSHLTQKILQLSIPVLLGMISYTAIQVADTFMVSSLGEEAIASTGIGGLVYFTVLSFLMNGSVGIQILTSRRLGEKREREIGKILVTILSSGFLIGILITFMGVQFSEFLISLISTDKSITPKAINYLSIRFLGTVFFVLLYVLRGFFDGLGQTYIGMIAAFVSMFSNIFLNWVFIYGNLGVVPMGIEGAAIASSLAGGLGLLVFLGFLTQKNIRYLIALSGFSLEWGVLKNIFTIGFPSAIDGSLTNISFLIFNKIAALISVSSVAGSQVIFSVLTISFMPGMAFGVAATTILGSGMGSGKFHLAEAGTYRCAKFSAIIMGFLGVFFIFFGKEILFLFGNNPGLVKEAYPALVAVSLVQVGDAYHMVLGAALRSAGYVLWVPLVYFCVSYFVMIPVAYLLGIGMGFGTTGLWSSISIWLLCMFSIFLWKFKQGTWKQKVL